MKNIKRTNQIIEVFHNDNFALYSRDSSILFDDLNLVAHLSFSSDTDIHVALEKAFTTTQNLDYPWTERPLIDVESATKPLVKNARSTSVGDVLKCTSISTRSDDLTSNKFWVVANVGFYSLTPSQYWLSASINQQTGLPLS